MNNETLAKRIKETTAPQSVIDAVAVLIAKNKMLESKMKLFIEVITENADLSAENERLAHEIQNLRAELDELYRDLHQPQGDTPY